MSGIDPEFLLKRQKEAELLFRRIGITFAVYGETTPQERIIPFDVIPRLITAPEWGKLTAGLEQRVRTLNAFLSDIYGPAEVLRAGIVPPDLIYQNPAFRPEAKNIAPPGGVYVPIAGIDVVRVDADTFYVLEDNVRTPSGVSYMLENRETMMRLFPELFENHSIAPVDSYIDRLLATLKSIAPDGSGANPEVVILTPGPLNSAYYEHTFLADKLGVELVEGIDLFVREGFVYMRTTEGPRRVDVIYRRVDDDFMDPLTFRAESVLGVPGLMSAYRAGNVSLANAIGTGIADDKAIYTYMPDFVRFYLGEEPILKNVPTWRCREEDARIHVLENIGDLVVKEVDGSGGYGMLIGPKADEEEIETFRARIRAAPAKYIAQPTLSLSTCPTLANNAIQPRHVDLRPFVLTGSKGISIVPGGLTRVALREGSLVVNSSQGGGTKDTWVLHGG
ncbi:MAG: circularly permuted type 2 ATP-grasp protein [Hyphomicrobiales bacterium]|nr:circularly permuted type 2 ATP-grasp protein [Hyphomicrobiales bacterium]